MIESLERVKSEKRKKESVTIGFYVTYAETGTINSCLVKIFYVRISIAI